MDRTDDRRNFLKLLLTGGMVAATPIVAAANPVKDDEETVTLLTEDGKLVTMKKDLLQKLRSNNKASNQDIQNFIKPAKGDTSK